MKDCKGKDLMIGDSVVYVHGKNSDAHLETGTVTKFYKGHFSDDECSVDGTAHIKSSRIMKLSDIAEPKKGANT